MDKPHGHSNRHRYDPDRHHRRSIRLQGYDYTQAGAYFVTMGTQYRQCLFGAIVDGAMVLNEAGQMIQTVWDEIPVYYPGVDIDEFVVMPDHIHGIVVIAEYDVGQAANVEAANVGAANVGAANVGAADAGAANVGAANGGAANVGAADAGAADAGAAGAGAANVGAADAGAADAGAVPRDRPTKKLSLPDVVHRFKTMTTKRYTDGVKQNGWPPFPGKLWQRNYWEHIIRNEAALNRIREYIRNNPAQWKPNQPDQPDQS
jgi:REP element-mobilizing transposase RayT